MYVLGIPAEFPHKQIPSIHAGFLQRGSCYIHPHCIPATPVRPVHLLDQDTVIIGNIHKNLAKIKHVVP